MKIREELLRFVLDMETQLRANDHKFGWKGDFLKELYLRLEEETIELQDALHRDNTEEIIKEAADVANFAMMIADNARRKIPNVVG